MPEKAEAEKATFIVFAGSLDKVMGAFILATTAAAVGMETTMFFTHDEWSAFVQGVRSGEFDPSP